MTIEHSPYSTDLPANTIFESPESRTVASYERELIRLRQAHIRDEALLRQKDVLIQQQELSSKESDHRLLNDLQMIVSLLSLQSRASVNAEVVSQLAVAANRVATIARVHQRLHSLDGVRTVAFKQYLEEFCRDFSTMVSSEERPEQVIVVEGIEIELAGGQRHSAQLHRQRTDHERGQIWQRPDCGQVGTESRKGLCAVRL